MVTDSIMGAINLLLVNNFDPEQNRGIGVVLDLLGDFDEDKWYEMSDAEKEAWVKGYLPKEIEKEILKNVKENKFDIDLGFATLVAEEGYDSNYKEVCVYLEDKKGVILQDLAIIGQGYHYEHGAKIEEENISVRVWADKDDEDYTHQFTVGMWEPEKEMTHPEILEKPQLENATHYTIKEDGVITGACCKVNMETNEVFDFQNEVDFKPEKLVHSLQPGDEYIILENRKNERISIILADGLTSDFERKNYYWRKKEDSVSMEDSKLINIEKLKQYIGEDKILEFDSPEDCLEYFNVYDYQNFQSVKEMKEYQSKFGFGLNGKWYHINVEEAIDVWNETVIEYKDYLIFEKEGEFTVGSSNNSRFDDCTLENLSSGDELEMTRWCMEHGENVVFLALRGEKEGQHVSFVEYCDHLAASDFDHEFIVPCVRFATVERAKEFLDWADDRYKGKEPQNRVSLDEKLMSTKDEIAKDVQSVLEDDICKFFREGKNLLSIVEWRKDCYVNYYNAEALVHNCGFVGPFESLEKAETMLRKHRPCAVEHKNIDEVKKLFYGRDKKQVLNNIKKFMDKELGEVSHENER